MAAFERNVTADRQQPRCFHSCPYQHMGRRIVPAANVYRTAAKGTWPLTGHEHLKSRMPDAHTFDQAGAPLFLGIRPIHPLRPSLGQAIGDLAEALMVG